MPTYAMSVGYRAMSPGSPSAGKSPGVRKPPLPRSKHKRLELMSGLQWLMRHCAYLQRFTGARVVPPSMPSRLYVRAHLPRQSVHPTAPPFQLPCMSSCSAAADPAVSPNPFPCAHSSGARRLGWTVRTARRSRHCGLRPRRARRPRRERAGSFEAAPPSACSPAPR
jgi:hypothetical protein